MSKELNIFFPTPKISWYPRNKVALNQLLNSLIPKVDYVHHDNQKPIAIIAPHAGYQYCASCAAQAFKNLLGYSYSTVVVLGPSHSCSFRGLSIISTEWYATPLERISINREAVALLLRQANISENRNAHLSEHSVDNMLPFLQHALGQFSLIPILVGDINLNEMIQLSDILFSSLPDDTLYVVSSDFTHYGYAYGFTPFPMDNNTKDNIRKLDMEAAKRIEKLDFKSFREYIDRTNITICGANAISMLIAILNHKPQKIIAKISDYYLSGDITHSYDTSVSYLSMLFDNQTYVK